VAGAGDGDLGGAGRCNTDALLFGAMLADGGALHALDAHLRWQQALLGGLRQPGDRAGVAASVMIAAARAAKAGAWLPAAVPPVFVALSCPRSRDRVQLRALALHLGSRRTSGAADLGMMRQFWGFTTRSLAPWLDAHAPEGSTVWLCDMIPTSFEMLHRDGLLRRDIRAAYDLGSADYAIVHHEDHFNEVDYQIWMSWGRPAPVVT
jgi:hypothetical protein